MTDSLLDILSRKDFEEPPEIKAIKAYVQQQFRDAVEVVVREREIFITCASAALAGSLRYHSRQIQQAANTTKRIVFRIR